MATGNSDPLPRLADALSELGDRLREISVELRGLQPGTTAAPEPPLAAPEPPPAWQATTPFPPPPPEPPRAWQATTPFPPPPPTLPEWPRMPEPALPPALQPARPTFWERVSREGAGSRILAWAGGVVTLAGVVLLLVLAIQRGYLGPLPRVLLGAGLGLALAGIGLVLHRNPTARTGAYALAATGIAVLYLDVIAATTLHEFLPPYAGLLSGLAVAGAGIALAGRWDSQLLAVFVVLGCAVSAPILTEGFVPLLLGFLLVLEIATTPIQLTRRWGGLCLAAGLPPVVATVIGVALAESGTYGIAPVTTAVLALVTSTVQVGLATMTAERRPANDLSLALLLAAPVPTLLAAMLLPRAAAAVLPAAIGIVLAAVWAAHRAEVLAVSGRFGLAAGAGAAIAAFQATATALDGNARVLALLGEALLVALIALWLRYRAAVYVSALFGLAGLALTVAGAVPPRMLAVPPTGPVPLGAVAAAGLTGLLLAVTAVVVCLAANRSALVGGYAWLTAGVIALYGSTGAVLTAGLLISPDRSGFLLGHVLVTVSWTIGALVLLLRGIDAVPLRVAGLALVAAALAKLVLFDLSELEGIARVAAFLVAGLVLLAAGARYARLVATRGRRPGPA